MREAQATARISHANVVMVYDADTFEDTSSSPWSSWTGTRSATGCRQRRAWSEVVTCLSTAGRGLAAAHDKDLVHRDFKPDNVMVSRDGHVRVIDFGLARWGGDANTPARPARPQKGRRRW